MNLWWLSYANEKTGAHNGVVIIYANSFFEAVARSRELKLSPGGQVLGEEVVNIPPKLQNRLLNQEDLLDYGESL